MLGFGYYDKIMKDKIEKETFMTKHIQWNGQLSQEGLETLQGKGGCIVCPTKVGYIIMTSDRAGLERKFEAKERNRNKPGVVPCGSMDELRALAQLNPEIESFYQKHWDEDILLGCILPWKAEAFDKLKLMVMEENT